MQVEFNKNAELAQAFSLAARQARRVVIALRRWKQTRRASADIFACRWVVILCKKRAASLEAAPVLN